MGRGGRIVAELHAFESEAVAGESVSRFFGNELFEDFTARLLCLGHGVNARIIAGLSVRAKGTHWAAKSRQEHASSGANVREH